MILQSVPCGRKSGAFGGTDIARELPKRHSFWRGETVADLGRRQAGGEEETVLVNRRSVERVPARGFEQPASLLKGGFAGFDSFLEPEVGIEPEHRQPGQPHALLLAAGGVDDGLALTVDLIDPEAGRVLYAAAGSGAEQLRLHSLREFAQIGGNRIVSGCRRDSEYDRTCQRRRDELPRRNAGGARNHQFQSPRKRQITGHRSDQDAKRHHFFEQLRHAEQRRLCDRDGGDRSQPRRLPDHFDVIDQHQQNENTGEHAERRNHEAAGKISPKRVGHHAHAVAGRPKSRNRRALDLLIASISAAGGSTTMPPTMIQRLTPIAVASIRYYTSGASGDFAAITEQANPAMRTPNTARIEPVIEKLRL